MDLDAVDDRTVVGVAVPGLEPVQSERRTQEYVDLLEQVVQPRTYPNLERPTGVEVLGARRPGVVDLTQ
ncbi:MAG: hypothetical protein J0H43_11675, partial [Actinobacteria bacterium]|nr:hypothetical protein [Actinomycetota bacterium]